jgi:hypothetical protein
LNQISFIRKGDNAGLERLGEKSFELNGGPPPTSPPAGEEVGGGLFLKKPI